MLHGMKQVRKRETGKIEQSLYMTQYLTPERVKQDKDCNIKNNN